MKKIIHDLVILPEFQTGDLRQTDCFSAPLLQSTADGKSNVTGIGKTEVGNILSFLIIRRIGNPAKQALVIRLPATAIKHDVLD
jgi:hypothetical protein